MYNKQDRTINGYDWWVSDSSNATIYFSSSHDRWIIEAPDVYFEASGTLTTDSGERRRAQGLTAYLGRNEWFQFSLLYPSKMVQIDIRCFHTRHGFENAKMNPMDIRWSRWISHRNSTTDPPKQQKDPTKAWAYTPGAIGDWCAETCDRIHGKYRQILLWCGSKIADLPVWGWIN